MKPNDHITYTPSKKVTAKDILTASKLKTKAKLNVVYNGERVTLDKTVAVLEQNNQPLEDNDFVQSGAKLTVSETDDQSFIFQDLFRFVSIDLSKVKGNLTIQRNGEPATFLDPLNENDEIEITF